MFVLMALIFSCLQTTRLMLLSRDRPTVQSKDFDDLYSSYAVDGIINSNGFRHNCTFSYIGLAFWMVELVNESEIRNVVIYNRKDCCGDRIVGSVVELISLDDKILYECAPINIHQDIYNISCNNQKAWKVRIRLKTTGYLALCEVNVFGVPSNQFYLSHGKITKQSSTEGIFYSYLSADGDRDQFVNLSSCSVTSNASDTPYWLIDLTQDFYIDMVHIFNRMDCCSNRIINAVVELLSENDTIVHVCAVIDEDRSVYYLSCHRAIGFKLRIRYPQAGIINICEVDVYGTPVEHLLSRNKPTTQSSDYLYNEVDFLSSSYAVDGIYIQDLQKFYCTATHHEMAFWIVDLGCVYQINYISIYNRKDCCPERLIGAVIELLSATNITLFQCGIITEAKSKYNISCGNNLGSKVKIRSTQEVTLTLCEVDVFGY